MSYIIEWYSHSAEQWIGFYSTRTYDTKDDAERVRAAIQNL
jgi:hypothetical protein